MCGKLSVDLLIALWKKPWHASRLLVSEVCLSCSKCAQHSVLVYITTRTNATHFGEMRKYTRGECSAFLASGSDPANGCVRAQVDVTSPILKNITIQPVAIAHHM